jgi:hypothetical protein
VGVEDGLIISILDGSCFIGGVVFDEAAVRWIVAEEGVILFCE